MALRSRLYIVLGAIGCALAIVFRDTFVPMAVLFVVLVASLANVVQAFAQFFRLRNRPAAFTVTRGRFSARFINSQAAFVGAGLGFLGFNLSKTLKADSLDLIHLGLDAVFAYIIAILAVMAWIMASSGLELTPEGVMSRTLWDRRFIPWEALSPGGPLRSSSNEVRIPLVFTRPELVRRGWFRLPGLDSWITAMTDVHPWLVADAIRWYVEHPEHRAGIGTEAEHERLLAAVGAESYGRPRTLPPPVPPPAAQDFTSRRAS